MVTKGKPGPYAQADLSYNELHDGLPLQDEQGAVGTLFVNNPEYLHELHGCTLDVENGFLVRSGEAEKPSLQPSPSASATESTDGPPKGNPNMSAQDRYIDARLEGIESKLDARLDAIQRFQEQADARAERAEGRLDKAIAGFESDSRATRWTVIGTGIAVVGLVATIMFGILTAFQQTISEQGAWLRSSVDQLEQPTSRTDTTESEPPPDMSQPNG